MKVSLEDVLAERERRAERQKLLLAEYGKTLVSLTLNMAGETKVFPWAGRCFDEEIETVRLALEAEGIRVPYEERSETDAGYAAFLCADSPAPRVKILAVHIEDTHPLGRLFDIDVFGADGVKLSRSDSGGARPCLVCGGNAFACARGRAHPVEQVTGAALLVMGGFLRARAKSRAERAALKAMLYEIAVTPKPGLVDRENNGAHDDMNFFTFIDSAGAIFPYFGDCAAEGFSTAEHLSPEELFASLRAGGRRTEAAMKKASGGVNTHKGIVFSLGILSAAYGRLFAHSEKPATDDILGLAKEMTRDIMNDFSDGADDSHGKALYRKHGVTGVRGEALAGFPSVRVAHNIVKDGIGAGNFSVNDAGVAAFLHILGSAEDTNIMHRAQKTGPDALARIRADARDFLAKNPSSGEILDKARALDREFVRLNVSPGGCADLLTVAFFLALLDADVTEGIP
jgi:holo-ACP synthase/triphosphoribosyl-dephospho-CoA synthase